MCELKSMIVLKNRIYCPYDHDHHTRMLEELGIKDDSTSPDFVRVEMTPKDKNPFNHNKDNWILRVDQDYRPDWFMADEASEACWQELRKWFGLRFVSEGHHEFKKGLWFASGSATVEASGSATVEAFDSATVEASGSATVRAFGSATVEAFDSATVRASGSATVEASGSATVEAFGSATVRAFGSATVRAFGSATVEAFDRANIFIPSWASNPQIKALEGFATVKDMRGTPKILVARDFEIKKFSEVE